MSALKWRRGQRGSSFDYSSGSYVIDNWPASIRSGFRFHGKWRVMYRSEQIDGANTLAEAKRKAEAHAVTTGGGVKA